MLKMLRRKENLKNYFVLIYYSQARGRRVSQNYTETHTENKNRTVCAVRLKQIY